MLSVSRLVAAATLLCLSSQVVHAEIVGRSQNPRSSSITLRERLHVNTLITAPGTMEVEWGHDYSSTSGAYTMPSTVKYTPEGRHILWGRTEFAAGLDTISSVVENDA